MHSSDQTYRTLSRCSRKRRLYRCSSNSVASLGDGDEQSGESVSSNRSHHAWIAPYPPKEVLEPRAFVILHMCTVERVDWQLIRTISSRGTSRDLEIPLHSLATSSTCTRSVLSISSVMIFVLVMSTGGKPPGMSVVHSFCQKLPVVLSSTLCSRHDENEITLKGRKTAPAQIYNERAVASAQKGPTFLKRLVCPRQE